MKIFLIGFMGAGKSTVGKKLAGRMNFRFLDTDSLIEKMEKSSIPGIFEVQGEEYFRDVEHKILKELVEYDENMVVSTGGGTPCYHDNMKLMNAAGITVYLKLDAHALYTRLMRSYRKNRPLIRDKSPEELSAFIQEKLNEREPYYTESRIIVSSDSCSVQKLEEIICASRDTAGPLS